MGGCASTCRKDTLPQCPTVRQMTPRDRRTAEHGFFERAGNISVTMPLHAMPVQGDEPGSIAAMEMKRCARVIGS